MVEPTVYALLNRDASGTVALINPEVCAVHGAVTTNVALLPLTFMKLPIDVSDRISNTVMRALELAHKYPPIVASNGTLNAGSLLFP